MKHLIVGDIHGFHHNLRKFLIEQGVVNKKGEPINRDEFKVYCTGDLIDGNINRQGDILNLEYAPQWFDGVCIGNHEYAFLGGRDFGTRRKHDRVTTRLLLELLDKGVYKPAQIVHGHLLTHAGFSDEFGFTNAEDALEFINIMWNVAPDLDETIAIFDWKNNGNYSYGDPTSGIFNLSWSMDRNENFPQVVGHTIFYTGPIMHEYKNDVKHWNIDVGAKDGSACGGIVIDDETNVVTPVHWGERKFNVKEKKLYPLTGEVATSTPLAITSGADPKNKDGLKSPSITDIRIGTKLLSAWDMVYEVDKLNLVQGNVELVPVERPNGGTRMVRKIDDEWDNWRLVPAGQISYGTIPIADLRDVTVFPVLQDDEILGHYRKEVGSVS